LTVRKFNGINSFYQKKKRQKEKWLDI
jgi:hypothetical protein